DTDSSAERLVFNRTVTLRDTWAKVEKAGQPVPEKARNAEKDRELIEPIAAAITIEDFSKIDLRVGVIREAGPVEGARKLIRLMVDIGEGRLRQIFAGIRSAYPEPAELIGKKVIIAANLQPRKMKFGISEGMVLSGGEKERLCITTFDGDPLPGDKVS
ncbi:MAG: methionine--tRNA ligase subunit beta, partial [Thermodesulfobacteriota bacterium]